MNHRYLESQKSRFIIIAGLKQIKLSTAKIEENELAGKCLETTEFSQCTGTIDDTHIEFFCYILFDARITIKNPFGTLEDRFIC